MKHTKELGRGKVMEQLLDIPRKIASLHGRDNVTEFVLHHLSHPSCFNFKKAAYFVDNPDFNYFKGVAGFANDDICSKHPELCWQDPESFTSTMKQAPFNQRVRNFSGPSPHMDKKQEKELIDNLAQEFSFMNPDYHIWHLKNNNHGVLVFEEANGIEKSWDAQDLEKGVYFLSFCPIF